MGVSPAGLCRYQTFQSLFDSLNINKSPTCFKISGTSAKILPFLCIDSVVHSTQPSFAMLETTKLCHRHENWPQFITSFFCLFFLTDMRHALKKLQCFCSYELEFTNTDIIFFFFSRFDSFWPVAYSVHQLASCETQPYSKVYNTLTLFL